MKIRTLPQLIAHWAKTQPKKLAVDDGLTTFSYAELYQRANNYAQQLIDQGVQPHDCVLLTLPKSSEAIAAILGTLMCGACYVPVDVKAPKERLMAMIEDAAVSVCIGQLPQLIDNVDLLHCVELSSLANVVLKPVNLYQNDVEGDAYLLYTSGSTGVPNGVRISHRAMLSFFSAVNSYMGVSRFSRCMSTSALYFDVSIIDTLLPLYQGASVWLGSDMPMPLRYVHLLTKHQITHMCAVGSTLNVLASLPGFKSNQWPALSSIMTGAEILNPNTMQQWLSVAPNGQIFNGYGPTEVTCVSTIFTITSDNVDQYSAFPIGQPIPGIEIHIQNDNATDTGELWLAGPQVMNGYLNREILNQKRLVEHEGIRFYRTGDRVRRTSTGELVFLGRLDDETKVRGYRIHLDDVAEPFRVLNDIRDAHACKLNHPDFSECIAMALLATNDVIQVDQLVTACNKLPAYMRPKQFIQFERFPLKPSGKVDVKLLRQQVERLALQTNETHISKLEMTEAPPA